MSLITSTRPLNVCCFCKHQSTAFVKTFHCQSSRHIRGCSMSRPIQHIYIPTIYFCYVSNPKQLAALAHSEGRGNLPILNPNSKNCVMVYLNRVLIRKPSILIGFLEILIGYFTQIRSLSRALCTVYILGHETILQDVPLKYHFPAKQ